MKLQRLKPWRLMGKMALLRRDNLQSTLPRKKRIAKKTKNAGRS